MAETATRPDAAGEALRVIMDECFRLQREQVGARELDEAKAFLAGSFPLGIETPDDIATKVLTALFYGLPLAELDTFRDRVNAVTPADIQRVTRAQLRPDRLSIVLVGYAPMIIDQLERVGHPERRGRRAGRARRDDGGPGAPGRARATRRCRWRRSRGASHASSGSR